MSQQDQLAEVVRYWWTNSQESIESAEREIQAGAYRIAVNRLYYAAFYAVSAVLLERGLSSTRHSGVRAAYHRNLIKPGLLDVKWAKFYDQLFEDRQAGDYLAMTTFDEEYVKAQFERCRQFLTEVRPLIASMRK